MSDDELIEQIRGAYREMPGLHLTARQARRLFGLDERTCPRLLEMLVEMGFLHRIRAETYARPSDGPSIVSRYPSWNDNGGRRAGVW